jgi:hypothetical protein
VARPLHWYDALPDSGNATSCLMSVYRSADPLIRQPCTIPTAQYRALRPHQRDNCGMYKPHLKRSCPGGLCIYRGINLLKLAPREILHRHIRSHLHHCTMRAWSATARSTTCTSALPCTSPTRRLEYTRGREALDGRGHPAEAVVREAREAVAH